MTAGKLMDEVTTPQGARPMCRDDNGPAGQVRGQHIGQFAFRRDIKGAGGFIHDQ